VTTLRVVRLALGFAVGLALALSTMVVWSWARSAVAPPPPPVTRRDQAVGLTVDSVSAPALGALVTHDPFRARRAPASVVYDPAGFAAATPPPAPPKPQLTCTGIAWGTEPAAVIEGLPGSDGPRAVHQGEILGGLRVTRIALDRVVIIGMDTTWTLRVREPWR
jgi:hypothetical protein